VENPVTDRAMALLVGWAMLALVGGGLFASRRSRRRFRKPGSATAGGDADRATGVEVGVQRFRVAVSGVGVVVDRGAGAVSPLLAAAQSIPCQ